MGNGPIILKLSSRRDPSDILRGFRNVGQPEGGVSGNEASAQSPAVLCWYHHFVNVTLVKRMCRKLKLFLEFHSALP